MAILFKLQYEHRNYHQRNKFYMLLVYIWKPNVIYPAVAIVRNGANRLYSKHDLYSAKGEYMP